MEQHRVLAIIGARSGSKGLPGKNIKPCAGRPLISWIIEAAKTAKSVHRVVVSTDSADYATVAKACGAEVPSLRPEALALDSSTDIEYIVHMLDHLKKAEGYEPDIVLRLLPTSPLQSGADIDAVVQELMDDPNADSAMVVAEAKQHPAKAMKIVPDGHAGSRLAPFIDGTLEPLSRQRFEKAYFRANVIASRIRTIREKGSLTGELIRYHEIPQERAIDIDSASDFAFAEFLLAQSTTS